MDEKELRQLLGNPGVMTEERGWHCPDEADLAAYAEDRLPPEESKRVESHLADCSHCTGQIAFLVCRSGEHASEVAPRILARARSLVGPKPSFWRVPTVRWATLAATAACVVLVFALQVRQPSLAPIPQEPAIHPSAPTAAPATTSPTLNPAPGPSAVRNSQDKSPRLELLSPVDSSVVEPQALEFRWREIPGSVYYEIHVVTVE